MGVKPFLVSAAVQAVMAQRLVRRVCPACATTRPPTEADWEALGAGPLPAQNGLPIARGCTACDQTGYRGRTGIFEHVRVNEPLRVQIMQRKP